MIIACYNWFLPHSLNPKQNHQTFLTFILSLLLSAVRQSLIVQIFSVAFTLKRQSGCFTQNMLACRLKGMQKKSMLLAKGFRQSHTWWDKRKPHSSSRKNHNLLYNFLHSIDFIVVPFISSRSSENFFRREKKTLNAN